MADALKTHSQCCQVAEILAKSSKGAGEKNFAAEEFLAKFVLNFTKCGRKGANEFS
jgi:hypothetical protein